MAARLLALALAGAGLASSSSSLIASISLWQGGFHLTNEVACACQQLNKAHPAEVLSSSSANYSEERVRFWDIRSDLYPACIFQPNNADEVAEGMKILSQCNAPFAIRGGGHMNVSFTVGLG